ncbi:MAG TPA: Gfo/Idh/MocA family oxidoreductase [Gemmatimonadales bacterium]
MTQPLPVGVVGVGALGRHHARHLAAMHGVRLVGVFDIDVARAADTAAEFGCRAFTSCSELLKSVEAVTVAVTTPSHHEVGLECLSRGVAVLMEKPLAVTLSEADDLLATAARSNLLLAVGHVERFNRAVRAAGSVLDRPVFIEGVRLAPYQPRGTDVAVVLDLMIHDLDLAIHVVGGAPAMEVRANGVSIVSPHLDIVNARVEFAGGAVASMTASRVARERMRRLRIFQPSGYISLDLATGDATFMRLRDGWRKGNGTSLEDVVETVNLSAPEADALGLELAAFVAAAQGDPAEIVSAAEGRAALALALEVTSAVERTPVPALGP